MYFRIFLSQTRSRFQTLSAAQLYPNIGRSPPPPSPPRGSRTANVAQDVHIKCCSIYLATLGAGVASSGQAIRQFKNEQETGPELTFAKTSGTVTKEGGGGGEVWPNGCPCYVALVFKSWFQTISNILVRCESNGQFWRSTCWYDPWWCLWFAKWFEQRTPWERWDKKGMIPQLD